MPFTRGKLYFSDDSQEQMVLARETAIAELAELGTSLSRQRLDKGIMYRIAGATVYTTSGIWNGETEFGFVLETINPIIGPEAFLSLKIQLEELAESLRAQFNQQSVLVTVEVVDGDVVFVEERN